MNKPKSGLWTNEMKKTKLPREYNRRYKLSVKQREKLVELAAKGVPKTKLATKFNISRTTVYLILDEQYRKRTYANTIHKFTREYMRKKKYESQKYKKAILDKLNKRRITMSDMKCPVCKTGNVEQGKHDKEYFCDNEFCPSYDETDSKTYDILIRTRKALETLQEFITKLYLNGNITDEQLERYKKMLITALEQKE